MSFQPKSLDLPSLKRLAQHLHRAWEADHERHGSKGPSLARSQELIARTFSFANWHEAQQAAQRERVENTEFESMVAKKFMGGHPQPTSTNTLSVFTMLHRGTMLRVEMLRVAESEPESWLHQLSLWTPEEVELIARTLLQSQDAWVPVKGDKPRDFTGVVSGLRWLFYTESDTDAQDLAERLEKGQPRDRQDCIHFIQALAWRCHELGLGGFVLMLAYLSLTDRVRLPAGTKMKAMTADEAWHEHARAWAVMSLLCVSQRVEPLTEKSPPIDWADRWNSLMQVALKAKDFETAGLIQALHWGLQAVWDEDEPIKSMFDEIERVIGLENHHAGMVFSLLREAGRLDDALIEARDRLGGTAVPMHHDERIAASRFIKTGSIPK